MDAAARAARRRLALRLAAFVPLELVHLTPADARRLRLDLLEDEDLVMRDHVADGYWSLTQTGYDWKHVAPLVDGVMPEVRTLIIHYADRAGLDLDEVCEETDMDRETLDAAVCDARYFRVSGDNFELTAEGRRRGRELRYPEPFVVCELQTSL
jgi:hypothetical protein